MKLIKIEQNCTKLTFPFVSHLLEKALEYTEGEYLLEDIYTELLNGNLTLWLGCSPEEKKMRIEQLWQKARRYNNKLRL